MKYLTTEREEACTLKGVVCQFCAPRAPKQTGRLQRLQQTPSETSPEPSLSKESRSRFTISQDVPLGMSLFGLVPSPFTARYYPNGLWGLLAT